jgi:hypothetical protein
MSSDTAPPLCRRLRSKADTKAKGTHANATSHAQSSGPDIVYGSPDALAAASPTSTAVAPPHHKIGASARRCDAAERRHRAYTAMQTPNPTAARTDR